MLVYCNGQKYDLSGQEIIDLARKGRLSPDSEVEYKGELHKLREFREIQIYFEDIEKAPRIPDSGASRESEEPRNAPVDGAERIGKTKLLGSGDKWVKASVAFLQKVRDTSKKYLPVAVGFLQKHYALRKKYSSTAFGFLRKHYRLSQKYITGVSSFLRNIFGSRKKYLTVVVSYVKRVYQSRRRYSMSVISFVRELFNTKKKASVAVLILLAVLSTRCGGKKEQLAKNEPGGSVVQTATDVQEETTPINDEDQQGGVTGASGFVSPSDTGGPRTNPAHEPKKKDYTTFEEAVQKIPVVTDDGVGRSLEARRRIQALKETYGSLELSIELSRSLGGFLERSGAGGIMSGLVKYCDELEDLPKEIEWKDEYIKRTKEAIVLFGYLSLKDDCSRLEQMLLDSDANPDEIFELISGDLAKHVKYYPNTLVYKRFQQSLRDFNEMITDPRATSHVPFFSPHEYLDKLSPIAEEYAVDISMEVSPDWDPFGFLDEVVKKDYTASQAVMMLRDIPDVEDTVAVSGDLQELKALRNKILEKAGYYGNQDRNFSRNFSWNNNPLEAPIFSYLQDYKGKLGELPDRIEWKSEYIDKADKFELVLRYVGLKEECSLLDFALLHTDENNWTPEAFMHVIKYIMAPYTKEYPDTVLYQNFQKTLKNFNELMLDSTIISRFPVVSTRGFFDELRTIAKEYGVELIGEPTINQGYLENSNPCLEPGTKRLVSLNGVDLSFVWIPEGNIGFESIPTIRPGFWISETPVTRELYDAIVSSYGLENKNKKRDEASDENNEQTLEYQLIEEADVNKVPSESAIESGHVPVFNIVNALNRDKENCFYGFEYAVPDGGNYKVLWNTQQGKGERPFGVEKQREPIDVKSCDYYEICMNKNPIWRSDDSSHYYIFYRFHPSFPKSYEDAERDNKRSHNGITQKEREMSKKPLVFRLVLRPVGSEQNEDEE